MKHIKKFDTHSEYNAYINGQDKILPKVSYCEDNDGIHFNPYASFGFLSKEKKMITIPYIDGLTSQSFVNNTPSSDLYYGFIATPIDYTQIEGKTSEEIDALFGIYNRTNLAKLQQELEPCKVYKVITFGKEGYNKLNELLKTNTTLTHLNLNSFFFFFFLI